MKVKELNYAELVYWNDPAGETSQAASVTHIQGLASGEAEEDSVIRLKTLAGGEVNCFASELEPAYFRAEYESHHASTVQHRTLALLRQDILENHTNGVFPTAIHVANEDGEALPNTPLYGCKWAVKIVQI